MALDRHPTGDRDRSRDDRTIVHVSAFPPTPSGVGLYSQVFDEVLSRFGAVTRIVAPADPRESQSLGEALRGLMLGLGPRLRDVDLVHIELSGRALFQFYVALGLSVGRRRSLLAITGHDAPSLTGWVFLFRELDRRPFRRLAGRASSVLGRRVEWFVLTRCDAVLALTREGAESLRLLAGSAHALPHVVDGTAPWAKEPRVFVPGYVSDADTVVALVAEVARHAAASGVPWRVAVGSTDPHTQSEVEGRLGPSERAIVGFTGHLDEDRLLAEFDRAFVVVRAVGTDQHNAFAASGPLYGRLRAAACA